MAQHGKKYQASLEEFDAEQLYAPKEALELVKKLAKAKFDETVEVHMRLNIDPRQAEQQLRGTIQMPAGLGKEVRILVFAQGEAASIARNAGADIVADDDETIRKIENGELPDFDIAIAVPEMMSTVGRLGRVLGPRGLMPNPKAGTVAPGEDLPRVIDEARAGRIEYRNDKTGNIHLGIGKVSFSEEDLQRNFLAVMDEIRRARPAAVKGQFVKKLVVCSTMGPGIKIDPNVAMSAVVDE